MVATRGNRFITIVLGMFWPKRVPMVIVVGGLVLLFGQMGVAASQGSDDAGVLHAPAATDPNPTRIEALHEASDSITLSELEETAGPAPEEVAVEFSDGFREHQGGIPRVLAEACPPSTLNNPPVGQPAHEPGDPWTGATSDADVGLIRYEYYSAVTEPIGDIHWWGFDRVYDGGWLECDEDPMTLEVKFYLDIGGLPGPEACSYTVTPSRSYAGDYSGRDLWRYGAVLDPPCALATGWVSIQGIGGPDCWHLWLSSGVGDGWSCFDDGGGISCNVIDESDFDLSLCLTPEPESVYKWDQPPVVVHPDHVYTGWDEFSVWNYEVVADDWVCQSEDPITHIHWWGSYLEWREPYAPPVEPDHWHILIWTDVPAGVDAPHSHPGTVIHEIITPNANVTREFVGWDIYNKWGVVDATFQYNYTLDFSEYFYQETAGGIYWITIAACYEPNYLPEYPWGWKTRPRDPASPAPDDAVIIWDPWDPVLDSTYVDGFPIEWPIGQSWDMAFELYTNPPPEVVKWDQPPTIDPDWDPEYFFGWNELSEYGLYQIVADDWACNDDRPITDIHWWGSYLEWTDDYPPPGAPDYFHIGIWRDVPAVPPEFSHPDDMIWEWIVPRSELNERWVNYDFHPDWGYESCFQYDFYIPSGDWFVQDPATENVYWLSISAIGAICPCNGDVDMDGTVTFPGDVVAVLDCVELGICDRCLKSCDVNCDGSIDYADVDAVICLFDGYPPEVCCPDAVPWPWGWKTRRPEWNDDAIRIFDPTAPFPGSVYNDGFPIEDWMGS